MASSARSVRSTEMPARHADRVDLVAQGHTPVGLVEEVSTSWQRSANRYGVNPDSSETPRILTSHELRELREAADIATRLVIAGSDETRPALVTPPERS